MKNKAQVLSHSCECRQGQGTIEYLVILAVVVVISLVVVALATNMFGSPSTQINSSTDKIGNLTSGGITVVESVSDSTGDSIIRLQNNSGETFTLNKITIEENETNFDEQLVSGDAKSFSLKDLDLSCPCTDGQEKVSCNFIFYLTTGNGLQKKQVITATTQCTQVTTPTDPAKVIGLGSGTLEDPWIINSCLELQDVNSHLDGNYALGLDINCLETINWNNGNGFIPIGLGTYFRGNFNGQNKKIRGLHINRPSTNNIGLFSQTQEATISNVGLVDTNIGGAGSNNVGGLVGIQFGGLITNSYSTGYFFGDYDVGGLAGVQYDGTISSCYAMGTIIGTSSEVAGLVGQQLLGTISNTYFIGYVHGYDAVGGITGWQGYLGTGTILNSYSAGEMHGNYEVGGLIGWQGYPNGSTITKSFSTCDINGNEHVGGGTIFVGGLIGDIEPGSSISDSYWDLTLSGIAECYDAGSSGCTSTDNNVNAYYGTEGVAKLNNDTNWVARDGNYPILYWQTE